LTGIETQSTPEDLAMHHGSFGQKTPKLKKFNIVGFDSEDDTYGKPLSFAFFSDNGSFYTRDADEAIDYIYNYKEKALFCAHNLEYDIGNLFKHCTFKYIDEMIYASKLLKCTIMGSKNEFLNSSSFFAGSLKKMGDLVGIPKLEGNSLDPAYNIRDAEIVYAFMNTFQERLHDTIGINLGVSIGQLSMNAYQTKYMRKFSQVTYNSPNCIGSEANGSGAYYGGRVEMFYKGIIQEKIKVADINSCYPKVMRDSLYPDTSYIEHSSIHTHEFGIGKFTVRVPENLFVPPLPFKSESGRLFFPVGVFTGWWTYAEVRYAMTLGTEILAEHEGEGTHISCDPFAEFIDDFYGQRIVHKKILKENSNDTDAKFNDLFLKLFQNNLYGKWCQHKPSVKMTRFRLPVNKLSKLKIYKEFKVGPFYSYTIEREKPPVTANYLWGVYVTSYARIYLHKQIMAVVAGGGRVIYCDTDSIMFTGSSGSLIFGDELGELSLEEYDAGIFRQAKGYLLCKKENPPVFHYSKGKVFQNGKLIYQGNGQKRFAMDAISVLQAHAGFEKYVVKKVACKGVPTHLALDFITKGSVSFLKPMRLKEANIRMYAEANKDKDEKFMKEVGVNYWREVDKVMKSIYIKRKGDRGVTLPVDADEILEMESKSFSPGVSMTEELWDNGVRLRNDKVYVEHFRGVKVPENWFQRTQELQDTEKFFESQKLHYFKAGECVELKPGEIWFSGKIIETMKTKYGNCFKIFVKKYLGENVQGKSMLGVISAKYFEDFDEETIFLEKRVEFILQSSYIGKGSLNIAVKLTGTEAAKVPVDEKIADEIKDV
jgi:hypothetical protein